MCRRKGNNAKKPNIYFHAIWEVTEFVLINTRLVCSCLEKNFDETIVVVGSKTSQWEKYQKM